jgi:hypothetical protein
MAVVQAIDQMHISGPATSGANCQFAREMRFGSRSERAGLLVPHVDPLQAPTGADGIRDSVQRVAGHSINALNARFHEYIHNQVRYFFLCHCLAPRFRPEVKLRLLGLLSETIWHTAPHHCHTTSSLLVLQLDL